MTVQRARPSIAPMSTSAAHPSPALRSSPGAGRIVALVVGCLLALLATALLLAGIALVAAHLTQRDSDGFYTSPTTRLATPTYALTGESIDLGNVRGSTADWSVESLDATTRIRVDPGGDVPLFVGVAPERAVDAYLRGVGHDRVRDVGHHHGGWSADYQRIGGADAPAPPANQRFWAASATGAGVQTLEWKPKSGHWSVVVMRADGGRGVTADVNVGVKLGLLLWIGVGLLAAGVLAAGGAAGLILAGSRGTASPQRVATVGVASDVAAVAATAYPYPVDVRAELEEPLSRWLWIVKWFLAIPHAILLAFLWIGFVAATIVAGFAILFTGRYPRGLFDFNVGVLRWSWRVGFYGWAALGTDRYPPFSLRPDPSYPADLEIPYPQRLSRPKVLVKSWLLALPHLAVLAAFFGWWNVAWTWGSTTIQAPGLLSVLVLVAGVVLLFTGRYPRDVFELVIGIARWSIRVAAYVALMRDEYPPFRLRR
jgi:hypothetical protein